jgi:hypothetical protein
VPGEARQQLLMEIKSRRVWREMSIRDSSSLGQLEWSGSIPAAMIDAYHFEFE